jgi:formate hydrogenlyase transcriptional activator
MASALSDATAQSADQRYRALLAVSEAIASHRDPSALFHELAGRLHHVVRFDYLILCLHEATSNSMRVHVLEGPEPTPFPSVAVLPVEEDPEGWVWQTQQARIFSNVPEETRWPRAVERAKRYGVHSSCILPLTSARRRLGTLTFACKQPSAYETAEVNFLQLVANQVAVSAENALAFQEIEALRDRDRALLAVSEAIVSHRDLSALFHELAGRLHQVVRFDYLGLSLYDATSNTIRMHVLEGTEPTPLPSTAGLPLEEDPAGWVWQTQQARIFSNVPEEKRWPRARERAKRYGVQSSCHLPLTTVRRRLGTLVFACKQPYAYETAEVSFLQLVANQVAVSVENALAFQELETLRDQLTKANAYLQDEVRTEHNFAEIIGASAALRRVLHDVETVAATGSTVLIRGETGTGKELIARAVHDRSPRQGRTFVKLNCAAIPTGLLESELFGHEKGAFTGAVRQKVGRFELAHLGTLFLDEAGDIPPEL